MSDVEVKMELRKCVHCKCKLLLHTYFEKNRKGEWYRTCNGCREKARIQSKAYRENNKKKCREYYEANKDRIREHRKAYGKTYYQENKEKIIDRTTKYAKEHPELRAQIRKTRYHNNKEKEAARYKQYMAEGKRNCDHGSIRDRCKVCSPNGYLKFIVSARVREALKSDKSKKTFEYLGCDIPTFRKHIEDQFVDGMSWDNHGRGEGKWNIDHIIPVMYCEDGLAPTTEQVAERLHYTNCQPMWAKDNLEKGNKWIG